MSVDGRAEAALLERLNLRHEELATLFEECSSHWGFEDPVAVRYATLREPPMPLPSGYAAFLYLYNLR